MTAKPLVASLQLTSTDVLPPLMLGSSPDILVVVVRMKIRAKTKPPDIRRSIMVEQKDVLSSGGFTLRIWRETEYINQWSWSFEVQQDHFKVLPFSKKLLPSK